MRHSRCGGEYHEVTEAFEITLHNRKAVVEATFLRCAGCGETLWTLEQASDARLAASKIIRREEGLLMPEDIVAIRRRYGLTQGLLQRLLGKGKKTVVAWESGAVFQSKMADLFLRVVRRFPEVLPFLAEQADVELPPPPARSPAPRAVSHAAYQQATSERPLMGDSWKGVGNLGYFDKVGREDAPALAG